MAKYAVFTNSNNASPLLCPVSNKVSFASAAAAEGHRDENYRSGRVTITLRTYRCRDCPYFHLTSSVHHKPRPDCVNAFRDMAPIAAEARSSLSNPHTRPVQAEHAATALVTADRRLRALEDAVAGADAFRAQVRASFAQSCARHVAHAERIIVDLVPLALESESWSWVVTARRSLMRAIEDATLLDEPGGVEDALAGYIAIVDAHIERNLLVPSDVYGSEFALVSDSTSAAVEYSIFDDSRERAVLAICGIEERAILRVAAVNLPKLR